ncbi:MAG: PBP1A family penicillin-binding protein [Candidatus Aminicenantes bacterium]|nr:PBP1A family penicillin-binding protein [Candidatus Aminicenantes bacterium]
MRKKSQRKTRRLWLILIFFSFSILAGGIVGIFRAIKINLPDVAELEHFEPNIITTVLADDGTAIKEFAIERRIEISYDKIPLVLKQAIVATEDPRFFRHHGVDFRGILRALWTNLKQGRVRRLQGGSTITQQLARQLFLYSQQTLGRKLKETYLALQIERRYSKEKIFEMYCNQCYLGHGVYGVETAANLFFGKRVSDLTLEEAALIAGIFRGPEVYSPYTNPEVTLRRRNHVLNRMAEEGFISKEEAEEAKKKPIEVLPLHRQSSEFGAYFFEEVRKYVEKKYGADLLYRSGLKIYTTLNPVMQSWAEEALLKRLREIDKLKGWRKDKRNLLQEGNQDLKKVWLPSWRLAPLKPGDIVQAIVLSVMKQEATIRIRDYEGWLTNKDIAWTRTDNLEKLIQPGDVIQVRINEVDEIGKKVLVSLDQEPLIEGAFLAIDPHTGEIKSMVGGYSFNRSKFNRATQALRQVGSAIKPILYVAALEKGFTPASQIIDEPVTFTDRWTGQPWTPRNYDRKYKGAVTLRIGIEESRNVVTAKLLDYISPQLGVEYCRKFGITSPIYPYLSLSLGAFEISLLELVSAYTVFPNKGLRAKPYFIRRIEDKQGNILEENQPESETVISPQLAYMMTYLLKGVIERGTAEAASSLLNDKALAGKTGTTDDFTDAWFIGFSPSLCAGVWIGYDTKVSIGDRMAGAVAALPVWIDFFKKVIEDEKKRAKDNGTDFIYEDFEVPPNLHFITIDRKTGFLATPNCLWPLKEVFFPGTEPQRYCTRQDHLLIFDYYGTSKAVEEHND